VLKFILSFLRQKGHHLVLLDPLELKLPILEKAHYHYRGEDKPPEILDKIANQIGEADGFVVVSAEYNHSIPPGLTNLLDHFGGSKYAFRPCAIVTYSAGPYGGVRAAMHLRSVLGEIGCLTTSNILSFPEAAKIFTEEGEFLAPQEKDNWGKRAEKCFAQLEFVAYAIRDRRRSHGFPQ